MVDAYILMACDKGKENGVFDKMHDFNEVIGAHMIFGEWDVMVKVKMESAEALGTFVVDHVRALDGVRLSSTLIVAK